MGTLRPEMGHNPENPGMIQLHRLPGRQILRHQYDRLRKRHFAGVPEKHVCQTLRNLGDVIASRPEIRVLHLRKHLRIMPPRGRNGIRRRHLLRADHTLHHAAVGLVLHHHRVDLKRMRQQLSDLRNRLPVKLMQPPHNLCFRLPESRKLRLHIRSRRPQQFRMRLRKILQSTDHCFFMHCLPRYRNHSKNPFSHAGAPPHPGGLLPASSPANHLLTVYRFPAGKAMLSAPSAPFPAHRRGNEK